MTGKSNEEPAASQPNSGPLACELCGDPIAGTEVLRGDFSLATMQPLMEAHDETCALLIGFREGTKALVCQTCGRRVAPVGAPPSTRRQVEELLLAHKESCAGPAARCWCIIHHPVTPEERAETAKALRYFREIGDSNGILLAFAQLVGPCPAWTSNEAAQGEALAVASAPALADTPPAPMASQPNEPTTREA